MLDFYRGYQWPDRAVRGEKHLTLNYARAIIDKITSYLASGLRPAVAPADGTDAAKSKAGKAEAALRQAEQDNNLEQLIFETELDCAVLGDACFKITWDTGARGIRVTSPDIQGIFAWWPGDDVSRVWRVASRYSLAAEEAAQLYGVNPKGKTGTSPRSGRTTTSSCGWMTSP
jgi:hypothetical protein